MAGRGRWLVGEGDGWWERREGEGDDTAAAAYWWPVLGSCLAALRGRQALAGAGSKKVLSLWSRLPK